MVGHTESESVRLMDLEGSLDELDPDISVILPCLDEEETVTACVSKAKRAVRELGLLGEVVVCNNGSSDRSAELALASGARVIHEPHKGYGNALRRGIEAARGRYIVIADADDTYDLEDIPKFVNPLRRGCQFVMGNRFKGIIHPGAMPWLHRYVGNPLLTAAMRFLFKSALSDTQCGMRAFTREAYERMELQTSGMEFASEMVISATRLGLAMTEVPIDYHARRTKSKLNSFQDGWRHLRFMLMYSPVHLYWFPGAIFFVLGLALLLGPMISAWFEETPRGLLNRQLVGSLLTLLGFQLISLGLYAKTYAFLQGFEKDAPVLKWFYRHFTLEKGMVLGSLFTVLGLAANWYPLYQRLFPLVGPVDGAEVGLVGLTFAVIGSQTVFSSFFLSLMGVRQVSRER